MPVALQNSLDGAAGIQKRTESLRMACKQLARSRQTARNPHFLRVAVILLAAAAASASINSQTPKTQSPSQKIVKRDGKTLFEAQCAVCHGLDGGGGEHGPDIARGASAKSRRDSELFQIVHDGLISEGMPSFGRMGDDNIRAVVTHLRLLQGKPATRVASGNPVRGRELFWGKGGCADCHAMNGYGHFVATDLSDFGTNHAANEIRDAILNPKQADGPGQKAAVVTTTAGNRFSGLIRNENNSTLQMQDAEGRFYLFVKSSLRSVDRSTERSMPANYQRELSATEVEDLVSYILHPTLPPEAAGGPSSGRAQIK